MKLTGQGINDMLHEVLEEMCPDEWKRSFRPWEKMSESEQQLANAVAARIHARHIAPLQENIESQQKKVAE